MGKANLDFVASPALVPPESSVDLNLIADYEKEMEMAAANPLPDDDDDAYVIPLGCER